jgi:hypothetical protein
MTVQILHIGNIDVLLTLLMWQCPAASELSLRFSDWQRDPEPGGGRHWRHVTVLARPGQRPVTVNVTPAVSLSEPGRSLALSDCDTVTASEPGRRSRWHRDRVCQSVCQPGSDSPA